jgi:hypothetical protein
MWIPRKFTATWRPDRAHRDSDAYKKGYRPVASSKSKGGTCKPCALKRCAVLASRAAEKEAEREALLKKTKAEREALLKRALTLRQLHAQLGALIAMARRGDPWSSRVDLPVAIETFNKKKGCHEYVTVLAACRGVNVDFGDGQSVFSMRGLVIPAVNS